MLNEQITYLKDNPNGYWFKRDLYGWGWTPARIQGWVALIVYILVNLYVLKATFDEAYSQHDTFLFFFVPFILSTVLFFSIVVFKGEKPKWQWGLPKEKGDLPIQK